MNQSLKRNLNVDLCVCAVLCSAWLAGCAKPPEIVEVECLAVHIYGTSPAKGTMSERFTHMTCERLDTKERRNFRQVYGKPGDRFKMDWNEPYYQ